ncbi:MAG TPA: HEAT repeat domain-containing protein [Pyrinomonadaceae bacterium]
MITLFWTVTFIVFFLPFILIYAYVGYCLRSIGRLLGHKETWKAWVPILNLFYICELARKPVWWALFLFIPFVNLVFGIILWRAIARLLSRPAWSGVLVAVPVVQWPVVGYLAGLRTKTIVLAMAIFVASCVAIPVWARLGNSTEIQTRLALAELNDPDRDVRVRAMSTLVARGDPTRAVAAFTRLLSDKDDEVRQTAVWNLGRMRTAARPAVPALVAMLSNNALHEIHRLDVVETLLRIEPVDTATMSAAIDFCVQAARHPTRADVRAGAIRHLGEVGPANDKVVPALIEALQHNDSFTREMAAEAVGVIGPRASAAVPALIAELPNNSHRASDALARIGAASVPALIEFIRTQDQPYASGLQLAIETVGKIGPAAKDAVPVLITKLDSENTNVSYRAAAALGNIGLAANAAVPALRAKASGKESLLKSGAVAALKKIEGH